MALALGVIGLAAPAAATSHEIARIELSGVIDQVNAAYVEEALRVAAADGAEAALIVIDSPGGELRSMDRIIQAILGSDVPVIAWVAPEGARAGSAATFVTLAADVAAMAPNTNIGAASVVSGVGEDLPEHAHGGSVGDRAGPVDVVTVGGHQRPPGDGVDPHEELGSIARREGLLDEAVDLLVAMLVDAVQPLLHLVEPLAQAPRGIHVPEDVTSGLELHLQLGDGERPGAQALRQAALEVEEAHQPARPLLDGELAPQPAAVAGKAVREGLEARAGCAALLRARSGWKRGGGGLGGRRDPRPPRLPRSDGRADGDVVGRGAQAGGARSRPG